VLRRNLGVLGEEWRIVDGRDHEALAEALGVVEGNARVVSGDVGLGREAMLPEVERFLRGDAPIDGVHHPGTGLAATHAWILEKRDVAAGCPGLVGVEEVVDGRVVLIHRLLDESEAQDTRVEVDVARRVAGDARDVVDSVQPDRASVATDR
jgi:hypothetical protein